MWPDQKMGLATDETRMKHGLSRSAPVLGRSNALMLAGAGANYRPLEAQHCCARGRAHSERLAPATARPIFIICGASCGMATDPKMRRAVDTGRGGARNSFRSTVRRSFAVRVSSTGPGSSLRRNEFRAPCRGVVPAPFSSFVAPRAAWRLTRKCTIATDETRMGPESARPRAQQC